MVERLDLTGWVDKLHASRILVIGDVMIDRFVFGNISRISPEAPIGVLNTGETKSSLGGAGNVVRNLLTLGAQVNFISVIGDDSEGHEIKKMLSTYNRIKSRFIVESPRKTSIKTRFIANRQQILRVDRETTDCINGASNEELLQAAHEYMNECNAIILSDYGKGVLPQDIIAAVIEMAKKRDIPVFIDPKGTDYTRYRGATVLTPNLKELRDATNMPVDNNEQVILAARKLIYTCKLFAILVTRSQDGMSLVLSSGSVRHLKAEAREVFDVSGAGDTVIAITAAAYGAGAQLDEAAVLANIGAGIAVGKLGTAVIYPQDLIRAIRLQTLSDTEAKVLEHKAAVDRVELWRHKGYKIGFTNGVFDLLHPGHLSLLSQAKKNCDRLIVGLNGDISAKNIKGVETLQDENARSTVLASLKYVDVVVIFHEDTPVNLLNLLHPDILIKGANYTEREVVGAEIVMAYGGEIMLVNISDAYSKDSILYKITNGTL